jgi:hypothetical protein
LLEMIGSLEQEPGLMAASPHMMCVGAKL